nr:YbjN domain-containing protein [Micromonospora nigra]
MPDGDARTAELERVAALAEAAGDLGCAVDAWADLVEAHLLHGERWRLCEPVRRCLDAATRAAALSGGGTAAVRAARAGMGLDETLRRYRRYAVESLLGTPRVGLDQAWTLLDGLTATDGEDGALVAQLRCRVADHVGDEPAARRWWHRWRVAGPDPAAGCPDCLPVRQAELLAGWGDWAEALALLEPLIARPAGCTGQPEAALTGALLPLLHAGEPDRAAQAHLRAYRRHRRDPGTFDHLATHLRFCALGGHPERGLAILAEQLPRWDRPPDDLSAMEFAAAGALVCALAVEAGLGHRPVHWPAGPERPAADIAVAALGTRLLAAASALAGSFDARNGTGHQSGRMASWLAQRPLAAATPLPAPDPPDGTDPDEDGPDDAGSDATDASTAGTAPDEIGSLTVAMLTAVLDRRGDRYTLVDDGTVRGRWDDAVVDFRRAGRRGDILHARVVAARRLPAGRRAEAYAFCNAWNRDRLLPKAYVHEVDDDLVLAGDVTTDLAYGVAPEQLAVLVEATVRTGLAYVRAVAALP